MNFNFLSIIYIILTFFFWYFIISCLSYLPLTPVNITLINGEKYNEVFLIEENPKGWVFFVDKNNKVKSVRKEAIIEIEEIM